ncbi:Tyrosinase [Drechslerella dactyloides]|uniref:tyrosinase n=1 Tax=Drechslerella dactyloides TaxID=74499 RepID=A0AAD6IWR0_DREDA|nr:Tyrosinase [Drechslerella dactyloides]
MKVSTLVFVAMATIGQLTEGLPTTPELSLSPEHPKEPRFSIGVPPIPSGENPLGKRDKIGTDRYRAVGLPDPNEKYNCATRYANYRQEIRAFETNQGGRLMDLHVCAMKRIMYARPPSDPNSYWGIAGIHGRPFQAWPDPRNGASTNTNMGYCSHSSTLFPCWHRPYISYMEAVLYWNAVLCISMSKASWSLKKPYWDVANSYRHPYWDWATNNAQIPDSYTRTTYRYNQRGLYDDNNGATFENPLWRYRFPNGYYNNPAIFGGAPWTQRPTTIRDPNANAALRNNAASIRSNVYNLMTGVNSWSQFSNHVTGGNSLESIHDLIHVLVGGNDGHMTSVPYSAFDPIFWIHHCNVDRLYAIWQVNFPLTPTSMRNDFGSYGVPPGTIEGRYTPFSAIMNYYGTPHTFDTSRDTSAFCFGFPECAKWLFRNKPVRDYQRSTTGKVYNLYGPQIARAATKRRKMRRDTPTLDTSAPPVADAIDNSVVDNSHYYEWRIDVAADRTALNGSYKVLFFLGRPARDSATWITQEEYVGTYAMFTSAGMTTPEGVDPSTVNNTVTGTVPLTDDMLNASVKFKLDSLKPEDAIPFLEKTLRWRCLDKDGKAVRVKNLKNLKVTVSTNLCTLPTDDEPWVKFGEWKQLAEITRKIGTDGGPDAVGAVPIPSASGSATVAPTSTSPAEISATDAPASTEEAPAVITSSVAADIAAPVVDETTTYAPSPTAASDIFAPTSTSLPALLV